MRVRAIPIERRNDGEDEDRWPWWKRLVRSPAPEWSRRRILIYETAVLSALWTFAGLHITGALSVPDKFGSIPVGVPFFGAVGAVLISLSAVFDFRGRGWDPRWEAWHYTRWLVGGTVAIVSVLIVQAGILSLNLGLEPSAKHGAQNLTYYLVAFVVGYREATFRELIKRLVDVILIPGGKAPPTVNALNPDTGSITGGTEVVITGSNLAKVTSVRFGPEEAVVGDRTDTSIVVTTPEARTPGDVRVTVVAADGADASKTFKYA